MFSFLYRYRTPPLTTINNDSNVNNTNFEITNKIRKYIIEQTNKSLERFISLKQSFFIHNYVITPTFILFLSFGLGFVYGRLH